VTSFAALQQLLLADPSAVIRALDRFDSESGLAGFIRSAWGVIEPGAPYVHGWHIDAIAEHLEAITCGQINRLLINVPPGTMKSLATSVFWPAWEWGPKGLAHLRYVATSHSQTLAIRDNLRTRRLVKSAWYQMLWGDRVQLTDDQDAKTKFENTKAGFREAMAFTSLTGTRGDRVIIDDPLSVDDAISDMKRETVNLTFLESVPTRLNNPEKSAIIVIMQRLHERDVSGVILSKKLGYEHLMLPMEFEPGRRCVTSIGFNDPRTKDGELLFPARFPRHVVERDKIPMGPYAVAGQFQQRPTPREGGIIQRAWWRRYPARTEAGRVVPLPPFEWIVMSLDTAYTEETRNKKTGKSDYTACTVWGFFRRSVKKPDGAEKVVPGLMLLDAWQERLGLPDLIVRVKKERLSRYGGEEQMPVFRPSFGAKLPITAGRPVDVILIEEKGSGISLRQMLNREGIATVAYNPGRAKKLERLHGISHIFHAGMVWTVESEKRPGEFTSWAEAVIQQVCSFHGEGTIEHDDYVDATTQALRYLADYASLSVTVEPDPDERDYAAERKGRVNPYAN
jgi:predicted phage terminase large subunit-like protein